jgi:Fic family protein
MDLSAFAKSTAGTLVSISGMDPRTGTQYDHKAYLPNPLPRETPTLKTETWALVSRASVALGRLDQAGRQLLNPGLLRGPSIRREAVSTSALEGTYAPLDRVLEADLDREGTQLSPQVQEVLNYVRAAELALDWVVERPVTLGMLAELQSILVRGTVGDTSHAGRLRDIQVVIGPQGSRIEDSRFVPPPPGDQLAAGVRDWESWLEEQHGIDPVIAVALGHYQFETLHPFTDGNGRLGRLVIVLQLIRAGVLREGILTVSPWLEQRRRAYQDHLLTVSQTGDFDPWIRFVAEGLYDRADRATAQIVELVSYQQSMRELAVSFPLRGVAARIAEDLIGHPIQTPTSAARSYGVSYQAANSAISRLVDAGVLREATGERYDRVFVADAVLSIVQS